MDNDDTQRDPKTDEEKKGDQEDLELIKSGVLDFLDSSPPVGSIGICTYCDAEYRVRKKGVEAEKFLARDKISRHRIPGWRKKCPSCGTKR